MSAQHTSSVVCFALVIAIGTAPAAAQERHLRHDTVLAPGWERIGGFQGATGSFLRQTVNDLVYEREVDGSLYRDLGDVSLGLGLDIGDGKVEWDNSFYRRVLPLHRDIEPGGMVTSDDLSSYIDVKTLISRGRLGYSFVTNIVGDAGVEAADGGPPPPCWMLRLYSDLRFADDLSLRIDLRDSRGLMADTALGHARFVMGAPTEVISTPFMTSRYSYDIPLPAAGQLQGGNTYTLLLRMLNADGVAVSEEQHMRLDWPAGGLAGAAAGCYTPELLEP